MSYDNTSALPATSVYLRHAKEELWRSENGTWLPRREDAAAFKSNIDALTFCKSASVSGMLVGFNEYGREVYELCVGTLLGRSQTNG